MSPSKPENEETVTDKSLGHTLRYLGSLLRDPKNLAIAAFILKGGYDYGKALQEEYWDEASIGGTVEKAVDKAIDKRLGKFEAGWDAFVSKAPKDTQLAVFKAQREYEKTHKVE